MITLQPNSGNWVINPFTTTMQVRVTQTRNVHQTLAKGLDCLVRYFGSGSTALARLCAHPSLRGAGGAGGLDKGVGGGGGEQT